MRDPFYRRTPEENFGDYIRSLYSKLNLCVWLTLSGYAVFYYIIGAHLAFYTVLSGALIINPAIYLLNIYQYRNTSRFLFLLSSNFYIYMSSLGLGHAGRIEYFLIPAAIVPLLIYDKSEHKRMLFMTLLPVITWAYINFVDWGEVPGVFHLTPHMNEILSAVSFILSQALTFLFVYIYRKLIGDLHNRTLHSFEIYNRELVSNKKFLLQTQVASKIGSWQMDKKFQVTSMTPQTYINMGLNRDGECFSYEHFVSHIRESDRQILLNKIINGQHSNKTFEHNCHMQTDHGLKIIKIIGQWLTDENQIPSLYGCSQDVSDIAELELEYLQLKNTMQLGAIFIVCEPNGDIAEASEDFTQLCGYPIEELHQSSHNIFDFSTKKNEFRSQVMQAAIANKAWMGEVEYKDKNGECYWTQTLIMPIVGLDQAIKKLFFLQFNITKQKKLHEQLIQSSKLTSLGEMAGGMAHEINTPLSIILMKCNLLVELLQKHSGINTKAFEHLAKIEITTNRIARIVSNLKTFSRNSGNDPYQAVLLPTVVEETLELCQERFKNKGIDIRIAPAEPYFVLGNSIELSQVLMNLLSNACDAIEHQSEKWIQIGLELCDGKVIMSVTDSGHGIEPAIAAKIMNPFFTTKELGKGTGLGLSISLEKIKKHGGFLFYDEKSPHTRFVVSLPVYDQELARFNLKIG